MKLTFHGAARTVTGSQHLIEVNGARILLDCGTYQGRRAEANQRNRNLPFDPASIDVMVLSHAHIDHSGNIPMLVKRGYKGEIICTHATRSLCATMLLDSGHIQERDAEFLNKKREAGEPQIEPIYTQADARAALGSFVAQSYDRSRQIAPGVTLTFKDAGHMLGSAFVVLEIEDHDEKRSLRLVFSGDIGRKGIPIIRDPEPLDAADLLIMESTYGDRKHPPYQDDLKRMERIIVETYQRGGVVIIPAFAVGRTQQLVYQLHQLEQQGDLPPLPVYVDSPLAIDATTAFRMHPECYDEETQRLIQSSESGEAFGFDKLIYTRTVDESKQLNFLRQPAIIISASGMMEAGRVLHHLKNRIEDPRTTIMIVGWQAEHTLGRRLVEHAPEVRIYGKLYQNRARIEVLNGFSGHADRDELVEWAGGSGANPKRTFLVHGELPAQMALAGVLRGRGWTVDIPTMGQSYEV